MTTERLHAALEQGPSAIQVFFQGAEEGQRRRLAPWVLSLYRNWNKAASHAPIDGLDWGQLAGSLPCALLATASLSELKAIRFWFHDQKVVEAILGDRRPPWLAEWAAHVLEKNPHSWGVVRQLCLRGWIQPPPGEPYVMGMIAARRRLSALELFEQDPALLEHLEALFEVEGQGEFSLAAHDKYCAPERQWSYALAQLSQRQLVQRSRLLQLSLQALQRDFEPFRAGWYSRFHEMLQPSLEERVELVHNYLPLLGSRVRPTVSFALKALKIIAKTDKLPLADFLREVSPALASPDKGTALAALQLVVQLSPSPPLEQLAEALQHPHLDIQTAALQTLEKQVPNPDPNLWRERGEGLAASLQPRWTAWLGTSSEVAPRFEEPAPVARAQPVEPCSSLDELIQLTARLLEAAEPAWEIERWLDGLVRFPQPESPRLTAPLLKRAQQLVSKHERQNRIDCPPLRVALAWLTRSWLNPESPPPRWPKSGFLQERLAEVAGMLSAGGLDGLRALPEGPAGWISAETLARRRHSRRPDWPWDEKAAELRLPAEGPPPPPYRVETRIYETFTHRSLQVDWPDGSLFQEPESDPGWRHWQAISWPAARELWATQGLTRIANNLDWWEAAWADRAYLENLLEDQPMGPRACLLLAFGLACKQAEQVGLAIDAALVGFQRGHLQPDQLGQALVEAASSQMIKSSRWAKSLEQVARSRPDSLLVALQRLVAEAPPEFDLGPLLPLAWELCHQLDRPLMGPAVQQRLAAWPGHGKQASLARSLLGRMRRN